MIIGMITIRLLIPVLYWQFLDSPIPIGQIFDSLIPIGQILDSPIPIGQTTYAFHRYRGQILNHAIKPSFSGLKLHLQRFFLQIYQNFKVNSVESAVTNIQVSCKMVFYVGFVLYVTTAPPTAIVKITLTYLDEFLSWDYHV